MVCDALAIHRYVHVTETQTNTELIDFSKTEGKCRSIEIMNTVLKLKFTRFTYLRQKGYVFTFIICLLDAKTIQQTFTKLNGKMAKEEAVR